MHVGIMTVGRWASEEIRTESELAVFQPAVGLRFDELHVRLTKADYLNPEVQDWMRQHVFCRVNHQRNHKIRIEVTP